MAIMGNAEEEQRHCILLHRINAFDDVQKKKLPNINVIYDSKSAPSNKISTTATKNDDDVKICYDKNCQACNMSVNNGSEVFFPTLPQQKTEAAILTKKISMSRQTASENATHKFFSQKYGPFLLNNGVRAIVIFSYVIYLIAALYGCMQFREGLEPSHLVTDDHYIAKYFRDMKMFWKMGPQLHVAILKPPNLTDSVQR